MAKVIEGQLTAKGFKFGIVAARFNNFVGEHLLSGAIDSIVRNGGSEDDITVVRVPGSFEIPITCKKMVTSAKFDAIITVGALIRGATSHYDLICNELTKGIAQVSLESGVPITFGVITADNIEQAVERSGSKAGNKGVDAALAAIEMVNVINQIGK